MGLDNYWVKDLNETEFKVQEIEFDPPIQLCGGLMSANGSGSFRGKVYNDIVEKATDGEYTLYEDLINEKVIEISEALWNSDFSELAQNSEWDISVEEVEDLFRMFKRYGEEGFCLKAWY